MAEVLPLTALHYDLNVVGSLADVVAPPYDVIDPAQRATLAARSPYNVVAVDLPQTAGQATPSAAGGTTPDNATGTAAAPGEPAPTPAAPGASTATGSPAAPTPADPYATAAALFATWQREAALTRDPTPAIWPHTQTYTGPDGVRRTRRGFFCRVRVEEYGPGRVRPHERTHAGPREDRLRLMRATRADTSAIFSLFSDPTDAAWSALEAAIAAPPDSATPTTTPPSAASPGTTPPGATSPDAPAAPPWGEVTDAEGTLHRLWRVSDPEAIAAVQAATRDAELLIADGHHRYETARAYAEEVGGEGEHRYMLMCLVALEDPGLTVFPTHRLLTGLDDAARARLRAAIERDFEISAVPVGELAPDPAIGPLELGYFDAHHQRPLRLTLKDQAIADAALSTFSPAYRQLDTGVLEALLLKGALGLTDDDISHLRGLRYARTVEDALQLVRGGECDAAFLMRPTPVEQVRDVAAAGENMPPKSTFFYPKLLTGLLFNPL